MRTLMSAAASAAILLAAGAANAADFPATYSDPYAPQVQETWSGFYLGGFVGYGWGDAGPFEPDGFLGGITAGINYQVDSILLGVEADIALSGVSDDGLDDFDHNVVGTVRGRIGYAFDRFVAYGTGGFAWTHAEADIVGTGSSSNLQGGWTIGGGLEAAITGNISAKAEYLYMDFSEEAYAGLGVVEPELHTFKVGVNYKF